MRLGLVLPRPPLPFESSDGRWFHVLCSGLPALGVELRVVAVCEGSEETTRKAMEHSREWKYQLQIVRPSSSQNYFGRLYGLWRPRTELLRTSDVSSKIDALMDWAGVCVFSGARNIGRRLQYGRVVTEVHYLRTVDQASEPVRSLPMVARNFQDRRAEVAYLADAGEIIVNSRRMEGLVSQARGGRAPKAVCPLTVDRHLYRAVPAEKPTKVVGFIGSMFWEPTRRSAERLLLRIWPRITDLEPSARLLVAGWEADKYLRRYFPVRGATLLADVRSTTEFFRLISVLVFPPAGGTGMKIKTLESMASGVPVVAGADGWEGMEDICDYIVPDDDDALALHVVELVRNARAWRNQREAGLEALRGPFSSEHVAKAFTTAVFGRLPDG